MALNSRLISVFAPHSPHPPHYQWPENEHKPDILSSKFVEDKAEICDKPRFSDKTTHIYKLILVRHAEMYFIDLIKTSVLMANVTPDVASKIFGKIKDV